MKTYKGRTPEEQRAFNQARKAQREAERKDREQGQDVSDSFALELETEDVTIPQLSWKDRLLSKFQDNNTEEPAKTKVEKEHLDKSSGLISQVLPMTISGLVALYSQKLFSEPYKKCAPTKQEVSTMLLPLFSIIHRHTKIEGKASQDVIDVTAFLFASLTIGTRMLMTAEEVRQHGLQSNDTEEQNKAPISIRGRTGGNSTVSNDATIGASTGTYGPNGRAGYGGDDAVPDLSVAAIDGTSEAEIVARLFKRDTQGRRQMGLAPRVFREED